MSDNLVREMLRAKAKAAKDPAFYKAQRELTHKLQFAEQMRAANRLSKAQLDEYRAHLTQDYLNELSVEDYVSMRQDGSYQELEAIARSHDGTRHGTDVLKDRADLNRKITREALDEALSRDLIDARRWNEEQRKIGTFDEETAMRVTDAADDTEHDDIALDNLLSRLPDAEPPAPPVNEDRIKSADED